MTSLKNHTRVNKLLYIFLLFAILFSACKVTHPYETPAIKKEIADSLYRDVETEDTTSLADVPWQNLFTDANLQNLINKALSDNLDLKIALERLNEADAAFKQSQLAYLPTLNANAIGSYGLASLANLNFPPGISVRRSTFPIQVSVSSSWEPDIWGKIKSAEYAAYALLWQQDAVKRSVQTQIVAGLASMYYQLMALDKNLEITDSTIIIRRQDVETMRALKEAAYVTGAAVVQSEANLYAAEVAVPDIKRAIREMENAISYLTGSVSVAIARSKLDSQKIQADLNTGIPLLLTRNRPDIQAAEFGFRAAFENTNMARANFYPNLTISATAGVSALKLKGLFESSPFFINASGNLAQVIFNRGLLKRDLKVAEARQMQAYYTFEKSLLNAGQEVSNALLAYSTAIEKQQTRALQINSLEKAVEFNKELLKYTSNTNYTDVLLSEQNLLQAQLSAVNDKLQELEAIVSLYRSLGGGWR